MSIIERLWIRKKPAYDYASAIDYIRELEKQRDKMLEALIETHKNIGHPDVKRKIRLVVREATGKSWEEIKELL